MKTMKLFVLTELSQKDNERPNVEVLDVFTTKTAAKERLDERKEELKNDYEKNYPDGWDVDTDFPHWFEIYAESEYDWTELLITEKELKK